MPAIVMQMTTRGGRLAAIAFAICASSAGARGDIEAPAGPDFDRASGTLSEAQKADLVRDMRSVGRRGFLYEVAQGSATGTGIDPDTSRLFLYGTIHLGRKGSEPFNGPVFDALRRSRTLALEADPSNGDEARQLAVELGHYDAGDTLDRHVSPDLMRRVVAFGGAHGIAPDALARIRPWLLADIVALTDFVDAGFDASLGSEFYLAGFARATAMRLVEIEGIEEQLHLLADLPDDLQAAQLDEALAEYDRGASRSDGADLFALWLAGDRARGDAMIAALHRDASRKRFERYFVDVLIDRRNRAMADRAEVFLKRPGNTFFAVGALHLFGERGLIEALRRRGYVVRDLQR